MAGTLLPNFVTEFPSNNYILKVTKSRGSDYEYVTLSSSYKQDVVYYFCWFRNMLSSCISQNAHENFPEMIKVFKQHKNKFSSSLRKYVLLEGIVMRSFCLKLEDSDLICEILNLLYFCWDSFGPLHHVAIMRKRNRNYYADFISFFLEHARRKKLQYRNIRMIDISLHSRYEKSAVLLAAEHWNWEILLAYLQYGAKLEELLQDPFLSKYGLPSAATEIIRSLIHDLWFQLVSPVFSCSSSRPSTSTVAEHLTNLDTCVRDVCQTLNVMLRAMRQVEWRSLDYFIRDFEDSRIIRLIPVQDILDHITVKTMVPKLSRRYKCPEELKHCCRWTIRKRLNENWQLPRGIRDLPVPEIMLQYLNLLID